jgi:hypothetical protein
MPKHEIARGDRASRLITQRIRNLGDWRGEVLAKMRSLILDADPDMLEEWKWMDTRVVPRGDCVHRRDVHQGGEAHLR